MKAKDRVALMICTNALGSVKLPPAVVGHSMKPGCFRLRECPLPYSRQPNAWVDSSVFLIWFTKVFLPAVRRHTSDKFVLLMDNASTHGGDAVNDPKGQVKVIFLPPEYHGEVSTYGLWSDIRT